MINEIQNIGLIKDFIPIINKKELINSLSIVINTASSLHAAINYSQLFYGGMIINCPGSLRKPAPTEKNIIDEKYLIDMLPSKQWSTIQVGLLAFLSTRTDDKLGHFKDCYFSDEEILQIQRNFQNKLAEIDDIIDERNQSRDYPYPYLSPKYVPNSTSI